MKHKKLPNWDELVTFYYNRYIEAGKNNTLPYLTEQWAKDVIEVYTPHFAKLEIDHIIKIFKESMPIVNRCKTEDEWKQHKNEVVAK